MAVLDNVTLTISLGFGSGPLVASPTWTDITPYVKSWNTSRGRSSILDRFDTGTGTIVVENLDGRFDPINTSSPYSPNLKIGTPVRIQVVHSAVTYTLFRGMVDSWPIQYSNAGQYSQLEIPITDLMPTLAGVSIDGTDFDFDSTGTRVYIVLISYALWPAGLVDGGINGSGVALIAPVLARGASAIDQIQKAVDVEAGTFFLAANGTATFQTRTASSGLASAATFGTGGGEIPYTDFGRAYDKDQMANIVEATAMDRYDFTDLDWPDGVTQTATDAASVAANGPLTLRIDAPFVDDSAAMNVAEWQVGRLANTVNRITHLSFDPDESQALAWPVAAGVDLRDGVTVKFSPPGGGTAINQLCSVEGIDHAVDEDEVWTTTFRLWPLSTFETQAYWTLGTSTLGTTARLA